MLHTLLVIIHIIGAGLLLGVVFFTVILAMPRNLSAERLDRLVQTRRLGFFIAGITILSGIALVIPYLSKALSSPTFLIKMGLIVMEAVLAGQVITVQLHHAQSTQAGSISKRLGYWMLLSLFTVVAIFAVAIARSQR
ncbi:MAG: hypothetical protein H6760_00230 [Candidatus Nomurabacteria bacterium]|nr:MAG: hypothetical protein H6760_00230 [Candidatus Nomurabacteria bacterium]